MIKRTPLESWIARKIGVNGERLSRAHLERYQLQQLRDTVEWALGHSPFYRRLLAGAPAGELASFADLQRLPFTTADDLREHGSQLLCLSQGEVSRVVTLSSSGTTGKPKRLYFTADDQERTIDAMQQGASQQVVPGDRVLILVPGEAPGSAGALLAEAFRRLGATPIPHGLVGDLSQAHGAMRRERPASLVGMPVHALALARYGEEVPGDRLRLKSAFLIGDHVPDSIVRELERAWGCQVFAHYGMTEMGLFGGEECEARAGYHPREADLYFEIVDPITGEPVPEGTRGEIVFTTLTRRAMPLVRYRTGDLSRFLREPCPCGTVLRCLDRISGRKTDMSVMRGRGEWEVTMSLLDEALFRVPGVIDFTAAVSCAREPVRLAITAWSVRRAHQETSRAIDEALDAVPAICSARRAGALSVTVTTAPVGERLWRGPEKRTIWELKESDGEQGHLPGPTRQDTARG